MNDIQENIDDKVLEMELIRNERIIEHPKLGKIRLSRPTPRIEGLIAEERRKVWHQDLKNPDILSKKQIRHLLEERGIWNAGDEARAEELSRKSGQLMTQLAALGFTTMRSLAIDLEVTWQDLTSQFEGDQEAIAHINSVFNLDNLDVASDLNYLRTHTKNSTIDEILDKAELLRDQTLIIRAMNEMRGELNKLLQDQTDIFSNTLESRAERAERLAGIFYCCTNIDTNKRLWATFDALLDVDPDELSWLTTQLFYFQNGITPDFAELLEEHGFTQRGVYTKSESENSQDLPKSNFVGASEESPLPASSELPTPTT